MAAGNPIDAKTQARVAELVGLGLSQREAAGACAISEKSVERILRKPEYKKLADDTRARRTSVTAQAAGVVHDLLAAVDDRGDPHMGLRKMGAELVMKNPALLEQVEQVEGDEPLLPGVVLRFPWAVKDSRDSGEPETAEQGSARSHESENGSADDLESPPPESPNLGEPAPDPEPEPAYVIPASLLTCGHNIQDGCGCVSVIPDTEPTSAPAPPPRPEIRTPDADAPLFTLEDMQ